MIIAYKPMRKLGRNMLFNFLKIWHFVANDVGCLCRTASAVLRGVYMLFATMAIQA